MAKTNSPPKKGFPPEILADPWLTTRKQFWMDMSESEFQYRVGKIPVKTGSIWPVLPLMFFLSVLIFSLVKIVENNVAWFNYIGLGLSLLGILMTIIWITMNNKKSG